MLEVMKYYKQLVESTEEDKKIERRAPKGYVPVIIRDSGEQMEERFLVHVDIFKEPQFVSLLEMAAREFGYNQPGVLRIPCSVEHFRSLFSNPSQ